MLDQSCCMYKLYGGSAGWPTKLDLRCQGLKSSGKVESLIIKRVLQGAKIALTERSTSKDTWQCLLSNSTKNVTAASKYC